MNSIYLDNNATTQIDPRVAQAMADAFAAGYVNPASAHERGRASRRRLEAARERIGQLLGARGGGMQSDQLLLTSGGTESNNLAVWGLAHEPPGTVILSAIEHPSIRELARPLQERGFEVRLLRVDRRGVADLEHLGELLDARTRLVSLMGVNHETGVRQPVKQAIGLCAERGVPVHVDAVQAVGKIPVAFGELGAAALSFTAHKFHGPRGIGGLLLRHDIKLQPLLVGGFQQMGMRPGTESVELAVGLERALELCVIEQEERSGRMRRLRDRFEHLLLERQDGAVINGRHAGRAPHTSNLSFPGVDRQALMMALDVRRIACSTGSACESGSSEPSPVLLAMQQPTEVVESSLRFSLSAQTTQQEIEQAVERIADAVSFVGQHSAIFGD